ncbi:MAG: hypothetical protein IPO56_17195 [Flavobacteriales bacterium]|nr:hypothetical protein [Flavobacteriales bacterium]
MSLNAVSEMAFRNAPICTLKTNPSGMRASMGMGAGARSVAARRVKISVTNCIGNALPSAKSGTSAMGRATGADALRPSVPKREG